MAIIQYQDQLSQLPQNLLNLMVTKQRQEVEREDLKLRKQDAALRAEEAEREKALQRAQIEGAMAAARFMAQRNPDIGAALQGLDPAALPSAVQNILGFRQAGANVEATETGTDAQRAAIPGIAAGSDVAVGTRDAQIEAGNLAPEATRAGIAQTQALTGESVARTEASADTRAHTRALTRGVELDNIYARLRNEHDPARVAQARALWESGNLTWGEARSAAGLGKTEGMPDEAVFSRPGGTGQNAEIMKNQGFAAMMEQTNNMMVAMEAEGVDLSFVGSLQRQTGSATFEALANMTLSPKQRQYIHAQRIFGDAYRFSLSGQQSSDREALRMLNSMVGQVGDDPATLANKAALRNVMIQVTKAKAGGGITAVPGAQMGLNAAKLTGDADTIDLFEGILRQAIQNSTGDGVANSPTDPTNLPTRLDRLGGLLDSALGTPPGGVSR